MRVTITQGGSATITAMTDVDPDDLHGAITALERNPAICEISIVLELPPDRQQGEIASGILPAGFRDMSDPMDSAHYALYGANRHSMEELRLMAADKEKRAPRPKKQWHNLIRDSRNKFRK